MTLNGVVNTVFSAFPIKISTPNPKFMRKYYSVTILWVNSLFYPSDTTQTSKTTNTTQQKLFSEL